MEASKLAWQRNRMLSAFTAESRDLLLARSIAQSMQLKTVLYAEYETPRLAYFPLSGVASVVALTAAGQTSEVGFIGCEGVIGAYHLIGPAPVPTRCFVQIEGDFLRIPFADLRSAYESSVDIQARIHEFIQSDSLSVSQIAGCNQMHQLGPRLARWLLMADDRHKSDTLGVTHDILAEMIASRRTTITKVSLVLKKMGLISYSRGQIKIVDRAGLERAACDCYRITKKLFTDLYQRV